MVGFNFDAIDSFFPPQNLYALSQIGAVLTCNCNVRFDCVLRNNEPSKGFMQTEELIWNIKNRLIVYKKID